MNDTAVSVLEPLKTAITSAITPAQLISVLAGVVGIGMTFVLMWFGVRKIKSIFVSAFQNGKLKI